MGIPHAGTWNALVHFPTGTGDTKVVVVFEMPKVGEELNSNLIAKGWIAEKVAPREGEFDGQDFSFEVSVARVTD